MLLIARGPQAQHATPFRRSRRSGGPNGDTALKPVVRCTLLPDHGCCQALPGEADQSRPRRRKPRRLKRLGRAGASGQAQSTPSCRAERGPWPRASSSEGRRGRRRTQSAQQSCYGKAATHWVRRRPRRLPPQAARKTRRPKAGTLLRAATLEGGVTARLAAAQVAQTALRVLRCALSRNNERPLPHQTRPERRPRCA